MKRIVLLGLMAVLALPGAALAGDFGVDAHAGTLGFGGELNYTLNSFFTVRGDFNRFNHTYNTTKEQINYDFNLHLKTAGVLLDLHPFEGTFRISAGYYNNKNDILAVATPQSSYTINGNTYSSSQLSSLSGDISFKSAVPYVGFGWSTLGSTSTGLGISFDVGALLQGTPTVTLTATGSITSNTQFQSDLAAEQGKLQNDVNNFKAYPVATLGLTYRF